MTVAVVEEADLRTVAEEVEVAVVVPGEEDEVDRITTIMVVARIRNTTNISHSSNQQLHKASQAIIRRASLIEV